MQILVDTKERNSDTFVLMQELEPETIEKQLEIGDIAYKNIRIELKSWADFINTLTDKKTKRFRNQLLNMYINEDLECYYIIYGNWEAMFNFSQINPNALLGAIASIAGRYKIPPIVLPNKEYAIYVAYKIIEKSFDHKVIRPDTHKVQSDDRAIDMICASANKVGVRDAEALLKHFGKVKIVANATVAQMIKVKGIGKQKAERIHKTSNLDFKVIKDFDKGFGEDFEFDVDLDRMVDEE